MSDQNRKPGLDTKLVHAGEPRTGGAVVAPIVQSATFEYTGEGTYDDVRYLRLSNTPSHLAVQDKLAALEGTEAALVTASGMAAISVTLLAFLHQGDHLLVQNCLYGGTHSFAFEQLPRWGIAVDAYDPHEPDSWEALRRPETKVIYAETITNPLIQVGELDAIAAFAKQHGILSVIDNTFASPANFRPAEWGFDIAVHSGTKYLNGHSDLVAGVATGSAEHIDAIRHTLNLLGGTLDPHACFLLQRGIKTLGVRMRAQSANAQRLTELLEAHPAVASVNYPGLASSPDHERASRFLDGYGGMLSFEVEGGVEAAKRVVERLTIPIVAPSLGGVETLVTRPATTSHAGMSAADRAAVGVTDSLIRVSVGIETADDLIADFDQALTS